MSQILDLIKPGDIVVTSQRGFQPSSWPIRFANFCKRGYAQRIWTHAAMYVGGGKVIEAFPSGITENDFKTRYDSGKFDYAIFRRDLPVPVSDDKVISFCLNNVGRKYDTKALLYYVIVNILPPVLKFVTDSKWLETALNSKDKYFCSELVAQSLLQADLYCFDRPPSHVMPVDFYNEYTFTKVYEKRSDKIGGKFKKIVITFCYIIGIVIWSALICGVLVGIFWFLVWLRQLVLGKETSEVNHHSSEGEIKKT